MSTNLTPDPAGTYPVGGVPTSSNTGAGYDSTGQANTSRGTHHDSDHRDHTSGKDESLTGKGIAMRALGVLVAIAIVTWIAAAMATGGFMDLYPWTLLGGLTALIVDLALNKALNKRRT